MGIKRIVDTNFWNDDKVIEMFSPEDKLFMLYLLTNPHTTQLGVYAINKKIMAFEIGYSVEAICVLLERFEKKYDLIKYSKSTGEIAIKNFLRHSIVKGGKPVEDLLLKEISLVKDKSLLLYVYGNVCNYDNLNETVKKVLNVINENYNVNDNDNDVSYHDSYDDSSTPKKSKAKKFVPPTLDEIKAYCKERNNNVDAQYFFDYFTVSNWVDSKGNKVKNWKQKVISWEGYGIAKPKMPQKHEIKWCENVDEGDLPY